MGPACAETPVAVVKVVDADTIVIRDCRGSRETIRLIGIDAPEMNHPSRPPEHLADAARRRCAELLAGGAIRLEMDALADDRDAYERQLRYVRLADGRLLNEVLVREGWAFALTRFPFGRKEAFLAAEDAARAAGVGVWADGGMAEVRWILDRARTPIEIFPSSNRTWALRLGPWIKPRVRTAKLIGELNRLVAWSAARNGTIIDDQWRAAGYRRLPAVEHRSR